MTPVRFLLGLVAVVAGLGALYLATTDVHYRDSNCGTALFASDPSRLSLDTGNVGDDQFAQDSLVTTCGHLVSERRFFTALPAATCVGAIVLGRRLRDRPPPMRGDIFGSRDV